MAIPSYMKTPDYSQHKAFTEAVNNHFDLGDKETRESLRGLHEEDQSKVLMALTTKLYDQIINKVDDIDYGEIARTKGDITKLSNYHQMKECIGVIRDLFNEYKQDRAPIDTIDDALENLEKRRELFQKAFIIKTEYAILTYDTIALAVVESLSLMISTCIEFIKSPTDDCIEMILNNVAVAKTSRHLLFDNLKKFNSACEDGDLDKALNYVMDKKNFLGGGISVTAGAIVGLTLIMNIIPLLRELIYFYYHGRVRMSDYLSVQADLLQINAYNLEANRIGKSAEERKKIAKRQMKIVEGMRKVSNAIAVDAVTAEKKATVEITKDSKAKYKASDVMDSMPDSSSDSNNSGSYSIF